MKDQWNANKYYLNEVKENDLGGECERREKCTRFWWENQWKETTR
jgi:hypothetical protein